MIPEQIISVYIFLINLQMILLVNKILQISNHLAHMTLQLSPTSLTLSGLLLSTSLTLTNPHNTLAVVFQIQSSPPFLQIQPQRSMLLQNDNKIVKMRVKQQYRQNINQYMDIAKNVIIRSTYYCQYNKKMMQKQQLRGWSKISKQLKQNTIPLYIRQTRMSQLKQSINRSNSSRRKNSFQKFRDQSRRNSFDKNRDRDGSRKNSFEKSKQGSSSVRSENKIVSSKLNQDIDFIFHNEQYRNKHQKVATKTVQQGHDNMFKMFANSNQFSQGKVLYSSPRHSRQQEYVPSSRKVSKSNSVLRPNMVSAQRVRQGAHSVANPSANNRSIQLIILAILAAVCVALGEGFGRIFKH